VINTDSGRRFVDAPEVDRIYLSRVTLKIDATEAASLPEDRGMRGNLEASLRRSGRRWKRRFGG